MDIEEIAALCAIIGFIYKALRSLWNLCAPVIKKRIKQLINQTIKFLKWLNQRF